MIGNDADQKILYSSIFQKALQNHSMSEQLLSNVVGTSAPTKTSGVWRPALFFLLVAATLAAFLWLAVTALSSEGFGLLDLLLVLLLRSRCPGLSSVSGMRRSACS